MRLPKSIAVLVGTIFVGLIAAGCSAPPYRQAPGFNERAATISKIVLLPPKVNVYEISTGGVMEKMDEWCAQADSNVTMALHDQLVAMQSVSIVPLPPDSLPADKRDNYDETQALFQDVSSAILTHTYGEDQDRFSDKIDNFNYSLGDEVHTLVPNSDVLLFVEGVDHKSSGGRKALQIGAAVVGALFGVNVIPKGDLTALSMALVDAHDGRILWYNLAQSQGGEDLREPQSATNMVKELFKSFPVDKLAKGGS